RPDPGGNVVVITKMLVFAIADSVALDAELGDIPGPNARVENDFDGGSGWNIHMRYAWEPCHVYALRVGIRDVETNGDRWYGAWIRDLAGGNEIYVGRIRVAASAGRLGSQSVMWSERFGGPAITTCEVQEHSSVVFSVPTSDSGAHTATLLSNAFSSPRYCPNSRFTELQGFVRQEMGVPAE
ncbi:MAG: hypothetical protein KC417_10825, partial [Myxococcales bacterium]|nr:hypothetical protein [Myxococcales bacterium]